MSPKDLIVSEPVPPVLELYLNGWKAEIGIETDEDAGVDVNKDFLKTV